ncbi:MAG: prephenate dehydratase, partial [Halanaerobiales bacterium]
KCDKIIPYKTIREIVKKVHDGEIERGIIPLENSQEGSVNLSLDLLFKKSGIEIIDEVVIPIEQFLLAPPGVEIPDIKEIYSHPQALAQSGDFVHEKMSDADLHYTDSTASAAQKVLDNGVKAMIGSRRIADIYPLEILAENIEGEMKNHTRFIVITTENNAKKTKAYDPKEDYKTSLICAPEVNRPGVLHEILGEFANRNIDLTRIESRPTKQKLGEYLFYIDLAGHCGEEKMQEALDEVAKKCGLFKILGSYPCANSITERGYDNHE